MSCAGETVDVERLRRSVQFLKSHSWIYDFPVTQFLSRKAWDHIPHEWRNCLLRMPFATLNRLPTGHVEEDWPLSLQAFVMMASSMGFRRQRGSSSDGRFDAKNVQGCSPAVDPKSSSLSLRPCRVGAKKWHEVMLLADLVDAECRHVANCHLVVDVGSGLGYLGHVLATAYRLNVIGLELVESRAHTAQSKHNKECRTEVKAGGQSSGTMQTVTFSLSDDVNCTQKLAELVMDATQDGRALSCQPPPPSRAAADNRAQSCQATPCAVLDSRALRCQATPPSCLGSPRSVWTTSGCSAESNIKNCPCGACKTDSSVDDLQHQRAACLTGLHCCGDLTPVALRQFCQLPNTRVLVCVGCCYHRMSQVKDGEGRLTYFPLSHAMLQASAGWVPSTYALRLAANETAARWGQQTSEQHETHTRHVAYRAVLEVLADQEGFVIRKNHQKLANKGDFATFESFIAKALQRLELPSDFSSTREKLCERALTLYHELQHLFPFVQILSALQATLQNALESLILEDRLVFLKENGIDASVIAVFDDAVSPRNMAIVARKPCFVEQHSSSLLTSHNA